MDQSLFWIALVGGEIFAVVFILLFIAWFLAMRQKGRDRQAINELVSRWASQRDTRKETLKSMLGSNYALSGSCLERTAAALLNAELRLVNIFSQVYLQRMADEAAVFDKSIGASVDAYHKLSGSGETTALESADEPGLEAEDSVRATVEEVDDEDELGFLRAENKRLTEELRVTMETMSRMLNEYSTMFASDGEEEVNVVMDVDEVKADMAAAEESPEAAGESQVYEAEPEAVASLEENPTELAGDEEWVERGITEATNTEAQSAEPEMPLEESPVSEQVNPDEILAAAAAAEVKLEAEATIEADLSAVADVLGMVDTTDSAEAALQEIAVEEPEQVEAVGSPYGLLEDAEEGEDKGPLDPIADLDESLGDTVVDDIDALLTATQETQPTAVENDSAEPPSEAMKAVGDLNEDFADLFDGEEVAGEMAADERVVEDLFDLTAEERPTEKEV